MTTFHTQDSGEQKCIFLGGLCKEFSVIEEANRAKKNHRQMQQA